MKKASVFKFENTVTADNIIALIQEDANKYNGIMDSQQEFADGFAPINEHQEYLLIDNVLGIKIKSIEKIIPTSYLKDRLKELVAEIEKKEGRKVSKKEQKNLKEQLKQEILPKAFTKTKEYLVYFDFNRHLIFMDSTSDKSNDYVISKLLSDKFILNPLPVQTKNLFGLTMKERILSNWFDSDYNTTELSPLDNCVIEITNADEIAKISIQKLNLHSNDVNQTLSKDNRIISSISMSMGENVTFDVNEKLKFSKIKNELTKRKFDPSEESIEEYYNSQMLLNINALNEMLDSIMVVLGG